MRRLLSTLLCAVLLLGIGQAGRAPRNSTNFTILGASLTVMVTRAHVTLPATLVPYLLPGDTIAISFPRGVQFSRSPRWHLIVADMYNDYLRHAPSFPIANANLSRAKAGHVWRVRVPPAATPIVFLVPENGSRAGRGIPDARRAIAQLQNRALLLRTATLSANAQAKQSTLGVFLKSLARVRSGSLSGGRARVAAATKSLFGYNLSNSPCFDRSVAQSTQYACAAQAVASKYDNASRASVITAASSQLSINAATYGMLLGTIYELLAKRRVEADYTFIPGVIQPGGRSTNVYVDQQPRYDATAANPSTIVYFEIGSRATSLRTPSYQAPPARSICAASSALTVRMPFNGLPIYFESHEAIVRAGGKTFDVHATYDPLTGFHAVVPPSAYTALSGGGTVRILSNWGFNQLRSPIATIVEPHATTWSLIPSDAQSLVMGSTASTLTLTDGTAAQASCVQSVTVKDATGTTVPIVRMKRTNNTLRMTLDTSKALGPTATAVVTEANAVASAPLQLALLPPMPQVTYAVAYFPKGVLVLKGSGLKYIDTVTLERTGIVFGSGSPDSDGSWTFTAQGTPPYDPAWEHETMAISYALQPPDTRTGDVQADVIYAPAPASSP